MKKELMEILSRLTTNLNNEEPSEFLRMLDVNCDCEDRNCDKCIKESDESFLKLILGFENLLQTAVMYKAFTQHPAIAAITELGLVKLDNSPEISSFVKNTQTIDNIMVDLLKFEEYHKKVMQDKTEQDTGVKTEDIVAYKNYVVTMKKLFSVSDKIGKLIKDKRLPFETFAGLVYPLNKDKMALSDECLRQMIQEQKINPNDVLHNLIRDSREFLSSINDYIAKCGEKNRQARIQKEEEMERTAKERKIVLPKTPAEEERIRYVKKANDMYQEFRLDFLRDLERQYASSTKDLYKHFIEAKVKRFLKNFEMPLASNTPIGKAKEVCAQIQNLMDYVSTISEQSYCIYPYSSPIK